MDTKIILDKQDMTHLQWSHTRSSSGTAGTFLKASERVHGKKVYYKLSNFDSEKGIVGHECVNEIIVDRLLTILGVEHLHYQLIHADVDIDGHIYETWLCASEDFKELGETKVALDNYYQVNSEAKTSHYDFCVQNRWQGYIDTMLAVDYLIMNRDRHGANIEVLRNARKKTLRIAPLFDHGLSFLCSCFNEKEIAEFDIDVDRTEKILMKASQKDFNKGISDDLSQYYCTDGDLKLYRKRNMLFKWQYFFKGENEPYGEFIANNDICK